MNEINARASLSEFGFTELESAIYCCLLRDAPATGYRIAKSLRKAPANVYSALSVLMGKGAVLTETGSGSEYLAVPPAQLLGMLEDRFQRQRAKAEGALEALDRRDPDNRTYQIASYDQAMAHAVQMIDSATSIILLDLFPGPFKRLAPALERATSRGVKVGLCAYHENAAIPGAIVAFHHSASSDSAQWPGEHMNIVTDARQHLLAMFDRDCERLVQAVASNSSFLACIQHSGLFAEISRARQLASGSGSDEEMAAMRLLEAQPDGLQELRRATGESSSEQGVQSQDKEEMVS